MGIMAKHKQKNTCMALIDAEEAHCLEVDKMTSAWARDDAKCNRHRNIMQKIMQAEDSRKTREKAKVPEVKIAVVEEEEDLPDFEDGPLEEWEKEYCISALHRNVDPSNCKRFVYDEEIHCRK